VLYLMKCTSEAEYIFLHSAQISEVPSSSESRTRGVDGLESVTKRGANLPSVNVTMLLVPSAYKILSIHF
jgi:hypothetical protein